MDSADARPHSFRRRYEQYRAREVEFYKQVIVRSSLLRIAEQARARLDARRELQLGEALLAAEVDSIIAERMALPTFRAWMRAQRQALAVRPSTAVGMSSVAVSPMALQLALDVPTLQETSSPVLVLQPRSPDVWQLFCEAGQAVVVVEPEHEERVAIDQRATRNGWSRLVRTVPSPAAIPRPRLFASVLYSPAACADLSDWEARELIDDLQTSTVRGGVHIVDGLLRDRDVLPRSILRRSYSTWSMRATRGRRDWRLVATRR